MRARGRNRDQRNPDRDDRRGGREEKAEAQIEARSADGLGTNVENAKWGSTGTELLRLADDARGEDGALAGQDRPGAREVSNALAQQTEDTANAAGGSDYLWIWGQFLDHDLSLTEATDGDSANIEVPAGDPYFDPFGTGEAVIPFTRVNEHDGTYSNEITSFIDASMVYGSDAETAAALRTDGGKLLLTDDNQLVQTETGLLAGDVRAAENVALATMHTIFAREHNRIVDELAANRPGLSDEALYQEARAHVEAIVQAITYNDFLPVLVGEDQFDAYTGYDATVNPGISVEFSTAVYRLGHTLLSSNLMLIEEDGTSGEPLALRDAFFQPSLLSDGDMIEDVLRGAATQTAQAVDTMVVEDVRSFLFGPPGAGGFDLAALNIQRGRDLGVASYNDLREAVGLDRAETFADITSDTDLAARFEAVYGDVDLVDAWVGGLAEDTVEGGLLGELFSLIMIDQFTRLRDGDPYWSHERAGLSDDQVTELWDTSLADVILRNTDIDALQLDVFSAKNRIIGTEENERLRGTAEADFLFGDEGEDRLVGRRGDDDLQGGSGADVLIGGGGDDMLTGGLGRDTFVFRASIAGDDTITDFEVNRDSLRFNDIGRRDVSYSEIGDDVLLTLDNNSSVLIEDIADEVSAGNWAQLLM